MHRTEPWQFKRVVAVIEHCAAREFVREVFDHHRGAHRVFTADAVLAAYLLTPMLGLPMHQTKVAEVVRGWSNSQRRQVGLPAHVEISYKSVNDALRRLMKACRSPRHSEWDERAVAQALLDARCGVTCRPGPWLWIRPTSRPGGGCVTASRSSTPTPTRLGLPIIRSPHRIRPIRMPAGAVTTSRTPRPGRMAGTSTRSTWTREWVGAAVSSRKRSSCAVMTCT
ncbi:hypothetical protein MPY17_08600 [Rhodococcus opacus]|uniref:hypothetical protein n=1 Tax=Rhodococcus opacus TaxID=37919 RepID=UPI001FF17194|nr:hypothetical protein [Rhodococcus opacus]UOT05782.1 hypothetical protein MPY17_08600 [Rhodococcus opacus]